MILRPSCSCCLPTTATNRRRTTSTGSCRVPFRSRRSTKSSVSAVGCEPSSVEHTLRCTHQVREWCTALPTASTDVCSPTDRLAAARVTPSSEGLTKCAVCSRGSARISFGVCKRKTASTSSSCRTGRWPWTQRVNIVTGKQQKCVP